MSQKIVTIDEALCTGCGSCLINCPQSALTLVDTPQGKKARLDESACDGLGGCIRRCPQGAIRLIERESRSQPEEHSHCCPAMQVLSWDKAPDEEPENGQKVPSRLRQWPVQLRLLPEEAPYLKNARLLLTADCVPVAYGDFQAEFLKDRAIALACPKLDDTGDYAGKLAEIFRRNRPQSLEVLFMEVPCCGGLWKIAREVRELTGAKIPIRLIKISLQGEILSRETL